MQHKHKISIALTALSVVLFGFGLLAHSSSAADQAATTVYLADVENLVGVAGDNSVALSWNPVPNANLYTVYYDKTSVKAAGGNYKSKATTGTNGFVVRNLSPDTPYYFAVAAEDTTGTYKGSYNYSNEISLTPLATPKTTTTAITTSPNSANTNVSTTDNKPTPILETNQNTNGTIVAEKNTTTATTPILNALTSNMSNITSENQAAQDEPELPQSGPTTNLVFGLSLILALLWVKYSRKIATKQN